MPRPSFSLSCAAQKTTCSTSSSSITLRPSAGGKALSPISTKSSKGQPRQVRLARPLIFSWQRGKKVSPIGRKVTARLILIKGGRSSRKTAKKREPLFCWRKTPRKMNPLFQFRVWKRLSSQGIHRKSTKFQG